MIRTDPDMADEFCYLNKRQHAYDFIIVDFKDRKQIEYKILFKFKIHDYKFKRNNSLYSWNR